jgi:hypothetical protein
MHPLRARLLILPAILFMGGCSSAPTVDVVGSYFPAWMECIILGLASTLIVRILLIQSGIYSYLRLKSLVFSCLANFFTLAVWLIIFKN